MYRDSLLETGAVSSNNLVSRGLKVRILEKAIVERLYLFSGLRLFAPRVNCPYAPTPPPAQSPTISRFSYDLFLECPQGVSVQTKYKTWIGARSVEDDETPNDRQMVIGMQIEILNGIKKLSFYGSFQIFM